MTMGITLEILAKVAKERDSQDMIWGRHPGAWDASDGLKLAVLMEEVGEVASELQNLPTDSDKLKAELIQVAAVAVCWAETL
jgi:NTP pyrophosphatase (non-canonical NTP hydrolase)